MNDKPNFYGIPYNQMLHDLAILKMQRANDLPDNNDTALISYYYETMSSLNDALNHYKNSHDF
ncbi:MAG: hypothetical protein HFI70_08220 [Lachnospiraceae bacterium]|nr:hypothetical protein [Lachnospiraceae bacterium]